MTDVLASGEWVAYGGRDRTAPHIFGDPIPDPLHQDSIHEIGRTWRQV